MLIEPLTSGAIYPWVPTLAWGFFFEKSQARPKSDILTCPYSSRRMLAGWNQFCTSLNSAPLITPR